MKFISIDIETLGLAPECDMIQFAAVFCDTEKPFSTDQQMVMFFKPLCLRYVGELDALAMHNGLFHRMAQETRYPVSALTPAFKQFVADCGITDTPTVAGKNFGMFDAMWLRGSIDFRHRVLDPGSMYVRSSDQVIPGFAQCCARAFIEYDAGMHHDALYDASVVAELIHRYVNGMYSKVEYATCD